MTKELKLHPIQVQILRELLFKREARFRDLNVGKVSTDKFTFHLKKLIKDGLIDKSSEGKYQLTSSGKEFANRFDAENLLLGKQAKLAVMVVAFSEDGEEKKVLFQRRLKHPHYGYLGFITGKVRQGEKVLDAAKRELKKETGLTAKMKYVGLEHKTDYSKEGKILEDKVFFIVKAEDVGGVMIKSYKGGENLWLSKKQYPKESQVFEDMLKVLKGVESGKFFFLEDRYEYMEERY